jgi:ribosomal protein L9
LKKKVTKTGKLYAAVSPKHLSEAFRDQLKTDIAEESIIIDETIKSLGEHTVKVQMGDKETAVKVVVEEEKAGV